MNGDFVKNDFENIFLANEGQTFNIIRNGTVIGSELGILSGNVIQMRAESEVCVDDVLQSKVAGSSYVVKAVGFETVGDVRTCKEIQVSLS